MTTFLSVPFAEKDQAKALGARWNAERKKWYVPAGSDVGPFEQWLANANVDPSAPPQTPGVKKAPQMEHIGLTVTGTNYIKIDHDCVPWLPCAQCEATLKELRAASA